MPLGKLTRFVKRTAKKAGGKVGPKSRIGQLGAGIAGRAAPIAVSFIPGYAVASSLSSRQGIKGIAKSTVRSFVPGGAVALLAYDAKRLRDRNRSVTERFRTIKKQALADAGAVQGRIGVLIRENQAVNPLYETVIPRTPKYLLASIGGKGQQSNTALPGPQVVSSPAPGFEAVNLDAPAPEERGSGEPAAEGSRIAYAGLGRGAIGVLLSLGLLAALAAARRGKE